MKSIKIALCQLIPDYDVSKSVEKAINMITSAAENQAALVVLPEMFYHPYELTGIRKITGKEDIILEDLCRCARECAVSICSGSMAVQQDGKTYNRSYLINESGNVIIQYDKCHLFDVDLPKLRARESLVFTPGSATPVVEMPFGRLGIAICYDIRFPEFIRNFTLKGAELLVVPAVFNDVTGPVHWSVMMQARAIENQIFIAAVSQGRNRKSSYCAYGHSMVVSPWGEVLCEASDGEEILYAGINHETLDETRQRLPLLEHRRPDLYKKLESELTKL
jgi:predicted amidohydrolase